MVENANNTSVFGIEGVPHFFLVNTAEAENENLKKCETLIKHYCGSKTELNWVTPNECLQLDPRTIAKTHVYVFPEFNGPAFEHLRAGKKALLLGPSALTKCLTENEAIPNLPPPWIHNMAMQNLCISLSGLSPDDKARYTDLVSFMGGLCLPVVPATATHLVSTTVQSVKYEVAVQLKIPIMQTEWIDEVWRRNQTEFIAATDDQFRKLRLPIFFNLNVCCTLLSNDEKMLVEQLVNENGGTFHRTLRPASIDILVLRDNGKNSDKFKAAMKHNKTCVTPKWISDSVEREYAIPYDDYRVLAEVRVSTPNKEDARNPEFSVSHIQGSGNTTVNDSLVSVRSKNLSIMSNIPEQAGPPPTPTTTDKGKGPDNDYYKDAIRNLTITNARKAGPFLDGCNIYFSGFSGSEVTKLNKIASLCGATRFEEIDENVTHVIVGKRDDKELKLFQDMNKGIHFVKFDWLKDSMEAKIQANEDEYCYELAAVANKTVLLEQPSPASKRNIAAMNSSFKKPFPRNDQMTELSMPVAAADVVNDEADPDAFPLSKNNLMNRYLHSSAANVELVERTGPQKEITAREHTSRRTQEHRERSRLMHTTFGSDLASDDFEHLVFFNDKLFAIQNTCNEHEHAQMLIDIRNFGGTVVDENFKGVVDFLVTTPTNFTNFQPLYKAKEVVTNLWMEDVISARSEVPIEYFHRLISIKDDTVLQGITCTISTYAGAERTFMTVVCQALGAVVEDKYEKKKFPVLICPKAEGSKYKGALNWEFPVVSKEWLLDSLNKSCLYKLEDYLVGESKLSSRYQHFLVLNGRGIHRGTEPPTPSDNDSSIIHIQSESPLLSQVPPSPAVVLKRKSDDGDTIFGRTNAGKKFKAHEDLALLPPPPETSRISPSVKNRRVNALRSESKSSASPTTPTSQHVREMGHEFGYDTPRRKQLYDVLKETSNITPSTPHTPASMKMPPLQLHPDPEATPGRQWDVLHKFSGFLNKDEKGGQAKKKKKITTPSTPLSEIKERFYKGALGMAYVHNNNSTLLNINTQQLEVATNSTQEPAAEERVGNSTRDNLAGVDDASTSPRWNSNANAASLQGLTDFIKNRKSEPRPAIEALETCPVIPGRTTESRDDIMVGWVGAEEQAPYESTSARRESKSMETSPFFLVSGLTLTDSIVQMISNLKGEVTNKSEFDSRCTHVICGELGRKEKVLCALAAGKWIVNRQYIEDSFNAKRFLKEEEYEWGNPKSKFGLDELSEVDQSIAIAAYTWRMKIVDPKSEKFRGGAFNGFVVMIWATIDGFKNIVKAGGGKVLDVDESYEKSAESAKAATHCFVEKKKKFPRKNLRFCTENSIIVCDIQYLNEYLLNENSSKLQSLVLNGGR